MTLIEDGAFYGCQSLKEVNVPLGIQKIDGSTFAGCSSLEKLTLPSSLSYISSGAFNGCNAIKYLVVNDLNAWLNIDFEDQFAHPLSASYKNYPKLMNKSGEVLSQIHMEGIDMTVDGYQKKGIKNYSMIGYSGEVTLSNSIEHIGEYAFYRSTIKEITMPYQLDSIAKSAFGNCDSLKIMKISNIEQWMKVKLANSSSHPLSRAASKSHTSIYGSDDKPITYLEIPRYVEAIPNYCFVGHQDLQVISFGYYNDDSYLKAIGKNAFYRCTSLTYVNIPSGVTEIGNSAFGICSSLRTVRVSSPVPPTLGDNAFWECSENLKIYVPAESLEAYKTAPGWSEYADKIVAE
jgi:hypothetical protein